MSVLSPVSRQPLQLRTRNEDAEKSKVGSRRSEDRLNIKFEIISTKHETNSNFQNPNDQNTKNSFEVVTF